MAHMVETMAYAGEVPWHGLGVKVSDDLTPQEMMKVAGLDWSVDRHPITTLVDGEEITIEGKKALVRSSDNKVLDVVGDQWIPVQNADAFEFFDEYVKAGGMTMHTAVLIYQNLVSTIELNRLLNTASPFLGEASASPYWPPVRAEPGRVKT